MKLDHLNPLNSKKLHNLDKEFFFFSNLFEKNKYPRVSMITGEKGIGKSTLIIHIIAHLLDPKNYNKKNAADMMKNKNWLIRENANRYSYRGKLEDYEKYISSNSKDETGENFQVTTTMNFDQFKKSRKAKSEPTTPSSISSQDTV